GSFGEGGGGRDMPIQPRVIRALLVLAVAAPVSVFGLGPSPAPSPAAQPALAKETDLPRVYARLPEWCLYNTFGEWCGLRATEATHEEAATLRHAGESARSPREVWCNNPLTETRRSSPPRTSALPKGMNWFRLRDSQDPGQWIGIGVLEQYHTGWTGYWIMCR